MWIRHLLRIWGHSSEQKRRSPRAEADSYPSGGTNSPQTQARLVEAEDGGAGREGGALPAVCTEAPLTVKQGCEDSKGANHVLLESLSVRTARVKAQMWRCRQTEGRQGGRR